MSTDLTTASETTLAQNALSDLGDMDDLVIPILKIAQGLTAEVASGAAKQGDFVNHLTGESFGTSVEFIICGFQKGRFMKDDNDRVRLAYGNTVPWDDDPFVGKPFAEHPEAEETFKKRVNAGEIEWGGGPKISTTYNFTGYVVGSPVPVRLSLMRTNAPTAKKLTTMLRFLPAMWDNVFTLETEARQKGRATYFVVNATQGRKTDAEERQRAVDLAQAIQSQRAQFVDETTGEAAPAADGALDI